MWRIFLEALAPRICNTFHCLMKMWYLFQFHSTGKESILDEIISQNYRLEVPGVWGVELDTWSLKRGAFKKLLTVFKERQ